DVQGNGTEYSRLLTVLQSDFHDTKAPSCFYQLLAPQQCGLTAVALTFRMKWKLQEER
ncbi:hypothetical protein HispidOSU_000634, partial [Sigmodon hispidus]